MMTTKLKTVKSLTMVGALISALVISSSALADHRGKGMHVGGEKMIQRMTHHLDMDKEQRDKIWTVYDDIHPQIRSLREQTRDNHKALMEAIHNNASKRDTDKLAKKQGELKAKMISLRADMQRRIRSQLTDEQRAKLKEMREHRKMRSKHRRGQWRDRKQSAKNNSI